MTTHHQLLYPLADILQMELKYTASSLGSSYKHIIVGKRTFNVTLLDELTLPLKLDVLASGLDMGTETSWIVLKVLRHLYALIDYNKQTDLVTVTLLDGSKANILNLGQKIQGKPSAMAFDAFDEYTLSKHTRLYKNKIEEWVTHEHNTVEQ